MGDLERKVQCARYIRSGALILFLALPCIVQDFLPKNLRTWFFVSSYVVLLLGELAFHAFYRKATGGPARSKAWWKYWTSYWLRTFVMMAVLLGMSIVGYLAYKAVNPTLSYAIAKSLFEAILFSLALVCILILCEVLYRYPEKAAPPEKEAMLKRVFASLDLNLSRVICYDDEIFRFQGFNARRKCKSIEVTVSYSLLNSLTSEEIEAFTIRAIAQIPNQSAHRIAVEMGLMLWVIYLVLELFPEKLSPLIFLVSLGGLLWFLMKFYACKVFKDDQRAKKMGANVHALVSALQKESDLNILPRNKGIPPYHPGNGTPSVDARKEKLLA
jgi:hypothetical protein